jgi:hypothetical protein
MPLMAGPDEATQVIKAAAVARGELYGRPLPPVHGKDSAYVEVTVPKAFAMLNEETWNCFGYHDQVPDSCKSALASGGRPTRVATYAGRYPPLYYLLVGWPSIPFPSGSGIHLMRIVSAFVSSLFLAAAFEIASRCTRSRLFLAGVAVAATPVVVFLAGVVNPSGLEIASAITTWVAALALAGGDLPPGLHRRTVTWLGVSAATLVEVRGMSVLWLLAVVGVFLIVVDPERFAVLVRDHLVRRWSVAVLASAGFGFWWVLAHHSNALVPGTPIPKDWDFGRIVIAELGTTPLLVSEMIGRVGWLDVTAPPFTLWTWLGLAVLLGALALASARRRDVVALCLVTVGAVLAPVVLRIPEARSAGLIGQGKDILPFVVAVPVLAAWSAGRRSELDPAIADRILWFVGAGAALAGLAAFLQSLRRFEVGASGPIDFLKGQWRPPIALPLLAVLSMAVFVLYGAWIARSTRAFSGSPHPS